MDIYRQSLTILFMADLEVWNKEYTCFKPKGRPSMNHIHTNTSILIC